MTGVISGGDLTTTIFCEHVTLSPLRAVTVQVTTVIPAGKVTRASLSMLAAPQASAMTGEPSVTLVATHWRESVQIVKAGGHKIIGGCEAPPGVHRQGARSACGPV